MEVTLTPTPDFFWYFLCPEGAIKIHLCASQVICVSVSSLPSPLTAMQIRRSRSQRLITFNVAARALLRSAFRQSPERELLPSTTSISISNLSWEVAWSAKTPQHQTPSMQKIEEKCVRAMTCPTQTQYVELNP